MSSSHLVVDIVISINRETTDFRWTFAIGQDTQLDFVILLVRISTFLRTECERYPPVTVRRLALAMRCRAVGYRSGPELHDAHVSPVG